MDDTKLYIFVDGGYFYHSVVNTFWNINYNIRQVYSQIIWERELVGIRYYIGEIWEHMGETEKEKKYYKDLRWKQQHYLWLLNSSWISYKLGYFNKWKNVEKSVDMLLAVDMIEWAIDGIYDSAIIITWDGDFLPAIEIVQKKLHKKVLNAAFRCWYSQKIKAQANSFFFLDEQVKTAIKRYK